MENFGRIFKNVELVSDQFLQNFYKVIQPDKKGEVKIVDMHLYRSFGMDEEKRYYYCKTIKIEVKVPPNVQMIQCILEQNIYWLHLSTSPNYTFVIYKYQRDLFKPFISQKDYNKIRNKRQCQCNFCPFPAVYH